MTNRFPRSINIFFKFTPLKALLKYKVMLIRVTRVAMAAGQPDPDGGQVDGDPRPALHPAGGLRPADRQRVDERSGRVPVSDR